MWPWTKTSKNPAPDPVPVPQPEPPTFAPEPPPAAPRVAEPTPAPVTVEVPVAPAPAPAPEHVQEDKAPAPAPSPAKGGLAWFTPTRIGVLVASVPSVLSLILMVAVVAEMTSATGEMSPRSVATGIFFDVIVAGLVAIAWFQPAVRQQAGYGAWAGAVAAAALIAWHYQGTEQMAFALVPLLAKFAWHLTLVALTAAEKRAADAARIEREAQQAQERAASEDAEADDDALSVEERREIAAIKRRTTYTKLKADAEADEAEVKISAVNRVRMAKDRAEAERLTTRYELAGQVAGQLPIEILAHFMPGLGQEVPARATEVSHLALDRSRTEPAAADMATAASAPAGFGAGLVEASARMVPAPSNAGSDLGERPRETAPAPVPSNAGSDLGEHPCEEEGAALARQRLAEQAERRRQDALALWKQGWCAPEIAAQMGRDKRTVRGYLVEEGVTAADMDQRIRARVASYIEHKGPQAETRAMAADLHLTRSEAKAARERLASEGVEVFAPQQ